MSHGLCMVDAHDRVVLFNTGAGLKYTDVIGAALGLAPLENA